MANYYYEKYDKDYTWESTANDVVDNATIKTDNIQTEWVASENDCYDVDKIYHDEFFDDYHVVPDYSLGGFTSYKLELTGTRLDDEDNTNDYINNNDWYTNYRYENGYPPNPRNEINFTRYNVCFAAYVYNEYTWDYDLYADLQLVEKISLAEQTIYKNRYQGSLIEIVVAEDGTYPDDGFSGDYYYYVKTTKPVVSLSYVSDKSVDVLDTLSFSLSASIDGDSTISYSASGLPSGANFNTSNGNFSWIPTKSQGGTYNVTFIASSNGSTDSESIAITVNSVYPSIESISNKIVDENQNVNFAVNTNDPDLDTINCYIKSGQPAGSSFSFSGTSGAFDWTPDYTQSGNYTVTFAAEANGNCDTEDVTITVNDILPRLDTIGDKIANENNNLNFTVTASISDDSAITLSANNLPSGASFDSSTGEFSWVPTYDQSGSYNVTFEAEANTDVDSETITITVNEIHKPPENLSPVNNFETENRKPTFEMTLPANDEADDLLYHARLRIADNSGIVAPYILLESKENQSNWEYYDGSVWQVLPSEGVPADTKVRVELEQHMNYSFSYWDVASWESNYGYGLDSNVRKINVLISTNDPYVLTVETTPYNAYSITAKETSNGEIGSVEFTLNNQNGVAENTIKHNDTVILAINDELGKQEQFKGLVRKKRPEGEVLTVSAITGDGVLSERKVKENYASQDVGLIVKDIIDNYCSPLTSSNVNTSTGFSAPINAKYKTPLKVFEEIRRRYNVYYFVDADWDMHFYLDSEVNSALVTARRGD